MLNQIKLGGNISSSTCLLVHYRSINKTVEGKYIWIFHIPLSKAIIKNIVSNSDEHTQSAYIKKYISILKHKYFFPRNFSSFEDSLGVSGREMDMCLVFVSFFARTLVLIA